MNARFRFGLVTFFAVLAFVAALSLGQWQLSRAAQKEALQAAIASQSGKSALDGTALLAASDPAALVHQGAVLKGSWVPDKTIFLDNRQMNAKVGFFAMTPFLLQGGQAAVLVQRGWAPRNFEDRAQLPTIDTPQGLVVIEGHIAPPPSKLYELGSAPAGAIRQNLDLTQFAAETALPLMAITLQQTGTASEGLLRDWPAANVGVDKHYGYAFQWFSLAALIAVLYLWFQIVRRFFYRPKDPKPHA
ncbi:MAG: hypothetical protein RLZZ573_1617 [Pseudomonadota bacterium]